MPIIDGLSILLVEDEFLIALDAEEMLKELGAAKVEVVGTFEQAEKMIKEQRFDLAILDVNLTGRQSFPLAKLLQERGTPVLFGTGYSLLARPMDGYDGGVCVTKPYSPQSLKAGVLAALESKQPGEADQTSV